MPQDLIFQPMGALAALTFLVLLIIPFARVGSGLQGKTTPNDFKYGESAAVPPRVSLPNRNYMNLLELPLLFYVVCLMFHAAGTVTPLALNLAWAFVALRAAHSFVHLTFNHVITRLAFFALSNVVLVGLWAVFFFSDALGL